MNDLSHWMGRSEYKQDNISHVLVRRMAATLGVEAPKQGEALPHLWHWMFFQPELSHEHLGQDGHPALGGFMPPANGRNRMWAGGKFEFSHPLIIGNEAECLSTIEKISEKSGSTGSLVFVTIRHEYTQNKVLCFTEWQNIVYREPSPPKQHSEQSPEAEWQEEKHPNATLLFRYSAVTFNGHRIHYDYPYVRDVEGYENLVVHGPMMATWALQGFIKAHPEKEVKTFEYRGIRPTVLPDSVQVAGRLLNQQRAEVWVSNPFGLIQSGIITFQ